ncbi:hypothetical protein PAHAL_5G049200 [Panicum hallii]|uniref:Late embryogenesis abundant protein LEA-2 subgroup domain-containing protein n=1 Tax=Panicum hallii TaxID=206008 RepID=A0A2T8IIX8_9POAL|nr:hypothetical protein PAHAL_5G049200 [Panicum hallii]
MAAHGGDGRRVTLLVPPQDGGQPQQVAQYPREGRNGAAPQPAAGRPRPSYVPPSQRRREQPPPAYGPYPQGGVPQERQQAMPPPPGGAPPPVTGSGLAIPGGAAPPPAGAAPPRRKRFGMATTTWATDVPDPSDARQHRRPHKPHAPGDEEAAPPGSLATPGGAAPPPGGAAPPRRPKRFGIPKTTWASDLPADSSDARPPRPRQHTPARAGLGDEAAPPHGGSPTAPEGPRRFGLPTAKTIERVGTLETGYGTEAPAPADSRLPPPVPPPHAHDARPQQPTPPYQPPPYGKKWQESPMLPTERRRKKENSKKPLAILFTLCCILFWLLVVCIGLAILVIYLLYHPKPPRLHVSTATLNAGYIDELPPPHLGQALNSDLYVLAAIYNPNTKIDVVLHYMQFDLYFQGHLIGTQAVWPPLYERPGDSALRTVHLVVSEVMMRPEDAEVWKNVTASGGLVQMQLEGRFYVQLNFGRWLPFRYMVKPSCALWLDPPPAGALRRARCRQ